MPFDVSDEIVIDRPPHLVAAFVGDPANAPRWHDHIDAARWLDGGPTVPGRRLRFTGRFLGWPLEYVYEVVEFVAGERLVMRSIEGPFPVRTSYTFQPHEQGATLLTMRNAGVLAGAVRLLTSLVVAAMHRANRRDLATLKRMLEAHDQSEQ